MYIFSDCRVTRKIEKKHNEKKEKKKLKRKKLEKEKVLKGKDNLEFNEREN